eukprot:scaffold66931_cov87-Phaeocystis_antarctica.AAC.2
MRFDSASRRGEQPVMCVCVDTHNFNGRQVPVLTPPQGPPHATRHATQQGRPSRSRQRSRPHRATRGSTRAPGINESLRYLVCVPRTRTLRDAYWTTSPWMTLFFEGRRRSSGSADRANSMFRTKWRGVN